MRLNPKKLLINLIKLTIAVVGLWFVVWPPWKDEPVMTWDDRITIQPGKEINSIQFIDPTNVKWLADRKAEHAGCVVVQLPTHRVHVRIADTSDRRVRLADPPIRWTPEQFIRDVPLAYFELVDPKAAIPEPKVQVGLKHLITQSNKALLFVAWLLLVVPFFIAAWRWQKLMEPQGIHLPFAKCLALTFVGQFYSTFLPGTTSGDLVKIGYTSKVTGSMTKSAVTVLFDRVIGLIALFVIAFIAAAVQAPGNPTMRYIAMLLGAGLLAVAVGTFCYFSRRVRRLIGLERTAATPENQPEPTSTFDRIRRKIAKPLLDADQTLHRYRGHVGVLVFAFSISLLTQILIPIAGWMAGMALGMKAGGLTYMAFIPLAALAAALPIAPPQGFGVTEWILLYFFHTCGTATAGQTFALAQVLRFLPVLWNLAGAYWVARGDYSRHQPTPADAHAALEASGLSVTQAPPG
jgi:glycosyltransferase 2 family protein